MGLNKAEPPGVGARRAALRLIDAVLRQGLPLEAALERATAGLAPSDRGLAHAIAAATLRWLPDLDRLIDGATQRPLPDDAKARSVLRLALAQALILETPPHAAISTALPLVEGGPRRLVHGVFGALNRQNTRLPEHPSLPDPVALRWQAGWGDAMTMGAAIALSAQPPTDLTLAAGEDAAQWAEKLGGTSLAPGHVRLPPGRVDALEGFAEGRWWVQDIAASLPGRLLGAGPGSALDLCAAPGGKTMQLASHGWTVTAVDASASRLARLRENLQRTGLSAEVVTADLLKWQAPGLYDAVLLDAPCSATGIFRRHPDVLHRVRPKDIKALAETQARLVARAADWVKPGGRLVYAVCSLERAEAEAQAERLLATRPDLVPDPVSAAELPAGLMPDAAGQVRTLPDMLAGEGGLDGFFVARFRRVG